MSIFYFHFVLGNLALCGAITNFAHHRMEEVKIKKSVMIIVLLKGKLCRLHKRKSAKKDVGNCRIPRNVVVTW